MPRQRPPRAASAAAPATQRDQTLLATKLFPPPPRPDLVARTRLYSLLDAGMQRKLTLLAAPAGSGKTTMLRAWQATTTGATIPLAWVALDRGDNDPARFWRYVGAALDTLHPGAGRRLAPLLGATPPPLDMVLIGAINALATLPHDVALVLDDYHAIEAPAIHEGIAFLLDHLPPHVHLIISTRADPPLPLGRLRVRDELVEIRADALRFSADEAMAFLTDVMALPIAATDVAALVGRTEGWIAGLQLAALSLQRQGPRDSAAFINAFAGSNRFVVDYLASEVLERQPVEIQDFLLRTAILDRLNGPLCDALSDGLTNGQTTLEALERANLFVVPLDDDRRWYRYHQLFAGVLRQRLRQTRPDRVPILHRQASAWFHDQGLDPEAIQHALAASDFETAATLLEEHGPAIVFSGQVHTVQGWLESIPELVLRAHPALIIYHAAVLIFTDQLSAAETRLRDAERDAEASQPSAEARTILGQVAALRVDLARIVGDISRSVTMAQLALELLPEVEITPLKLRAIVASDRSRAYLVTGDVSLASERLATDVIAPVVTTGNHFTALTSLTSLARLQTIQGSLNRAATTYAAALKAGTEQGDLEALFGGVTYFLGLGELLHERNELDIAEQLLTQGMALARGTIAADAYYVALGSFALARVYQARGAFERAHATLDDFTDIAHRRHFVAPLRDACAAIRARLWLAQGELDAAVRWADTSSLHPDDALDYQRESEYLALARVNIARARGDSASGSLQPIDDTLGLLDRLLAAAESGNRLGSAIEILVLRALAFDSRGERGSALAALARAVSQAAPEGYCRVFLDEGAPLGALLARLHADRHQGSPDSLSPAARAHSATLLAAFAAESPPTATAPAAQQKSTDPAPLDPLTAREREVLQLIAEGLANPAIAERLFLTVGTVKWYVNTIFGKLAVTSRTQAVARARALHLLDD